MKVVLIGLLVFLVGSYYYFSSSVPKAAQEKNVPTPRPQQSTLPFIPHTRENYLKLVNDYRVSMGKKPLVQDDRICPIAEERVKDLNIEYSHKGADKLITAVVTDLGYEKVSENIAELGWYDAEGTVERWLNSTPHRNAILSSYTHTCIASDGRYSVQIFAE